MAETQAAGSPGSRRTTAGSAAWPGSMVGTIGLPRRRALTSNPDPGTRTTFSMTSPSASASGIIPRTEISPPTVAARRSRRPSSADCATAGSRNSICTSGGAGTGPRPHCMRAPCLRIQPSETCATDNRATKSPKGASRRRHSSIVLAELRYRGGKHFPEEERDAQLPPSAPRAFLHGRVQHPLHAGEKVHERADPDEMVQSAPRQGQGRPVPPEGPHQGPIGEEEKAQRKSGHRGIDPDGAVADGNRRRDPAGACEAHREGPAFGRSPRRLVPCDVGREGGQHRAQVQSRQAVGAGRMPQRAPAPSVQRSVHVSAPAGLRSGNVAGRSRSPLPRGDCDDGIGCADTGGLGRGIRPRGMGATPGAARRPCAPGAPAPRLPRRRWNGAGRRGASN